MIRQVRSFDTSEAATQFYKSMVRMSRGEYIIHRPIPIGTAENRRWEVRFGAYPQQANEKWGVSDNEPT